jgi:hypothetical protein
MDGEGDKVKDCLPLPGLEEKDYWSRPGDPAAIMGQFSTDDLVVTRAT